MNQPKKDWQKEKVKLYFGNKHIMHEKSHGIPYVNIELGRISVIKKLLHSQAREILDEAIAIFEKLPEDEPMTKNPVILELKVLKEKWKRKNI